MSATLLRIIFLGCYALLWRWNRRLLAMDVRFRWKREGIWIFLLLVVPIVIWTIWPLPYISSITWALTLFGLARIAWRLSMRLVDLAAVRSRPADVPSARGRILTTRALQVRSYSFDDAPSHIHGLSVALISDLHCDGWPEPLWYDRFWKVVKGLQPDLILLAGDFVSRPESVPILKRCLRDLSRIRPGMGIRAVLGNHDQVAIEGVREVLQEQDIVLLQDQTEVLVHPNGRSLRLAGTSWPWCGSESVRKCMEDGAVDIALTHTPDNALELANAGARWILAGHTHGGQFALPVIGGILSPSRFGGRWLYGHHTVGQSHLVVTSGVGCTGLPARILVHPEIALLRF
jgi:uncharacterized protein